MGYVEAIGDFGAGFERWVVALKLTKAEHQVFFDTRKPGKVVPHLCHDSITGERLNTYQARKLLIHQFENFGVSGWNFVPQRDRHVNRLHKACAFEVVIGPFDYNRVHPYFEPIYVKLSIETDFMDRRAGIEPTKMDKIFIHSFHPTSRSSS